ncbi:hypothetical protein BV20DRAFT_1056057 [Pilatotrama ljubarskyi]|nr:hypothetical protein BV20DRAFT_1056057 [Pilatotrama ljubarskyi]
MHFCLTVPELFERILHYVVLELPPGDPFAGYHLPTFKDPTIAHLARTCRLFLEPSLNSLWRNQITLLPLLRTLPDDAWGEVYDSKGKWTGTDDPLRPLMPRDWERFDYYAQRIQALGFFNYEFEDQESRIWEWPSAAGQALSVSVATMSWLSQHRRKPWLLPNLRRLRWNAYDAGITRFLPIFLGPRFTSLAICFKPQLAFDLLTYRPQDLAGVLGVLHHICPSATGLQVYQRHPSSVVGPAKEFGYNCDELRAYSVNARLHAEDMPLLCGLASRPRLAKVFLSMDDVLLGKLDRMHWKLPCGLSPLPAFSALEELWLRLPSLGPCADFIRSMHTCQLHTVILELTGLCGAPAVYAFFVALRDRCNRATLQVLRMRQISVPPEAENAPVSPEECVTGADLVPLLEFHNVRSFKLDLCLFGEFIWWDVESIADAWPLLVDLVLLGEWGTSVRRTISWRSIAYLLSRCQYLEVLHLAFAVGVYNMQDFTRRRDFRPNHCLRILHILDSGLPMDFSSFAFSIWIVAPRLQVLHGWGTGAQYEEPPDEYLSLVMRLVWTYRHYDRPDIFGTGGLPDSSIGNEPTHWEPF